MTAPPSTAPRLLTADEMLAAAAAVENLGGLLLERRLTRGLSRQQVALASGVPYSTVRRLEDGDGGTSVTVAAVLRWLAR